MKQRERVAVSDAPKLLSDEGLRQKGVRFSRAQRWRLIRAHKFPAPVKIGDNTNAWVESEIDAWIAARIRDRDAKHAAPAEAQAA
jgi:prophage regulatory protein